MKKLLSMIMVAALSAGAANAAAVKAGTVTMTKGGVDVVKANTVMGKMARQGTDLLMDDILRTKRASYAEVNAIDGTKIKVFEKSRLVFNGVARTKDGYNAELQSGKVLFKVEKMYNVAGDFRIKTSNAVIGVKGTSFGLLRGPMGTVVELYRGSLAIAAVNNAPGQINLQSPTMFGTPPVPVVIAPGQGVVITNGGSVTTYSFGTPGAPPSALFPGAAPSRPVQEGTSAGAGSEDQLFGVIGSGEAAKAGDDSGDGGDDPAPSPMASTPPASQSTGPENAAGLVNSLTGTNGPGNGIYNSANRPSTAAQVVRSMGTVNVHIDFH